MFDFFFFLSRSFFSFLNSSPSCSSFYSLYECIWLIMFVISLFVCSEDSFSWDRKYFGKIWCFFNSFNPNVKRLIQRRKSINYKIGRNEVSVLSNQTCFKEKMLPIERDRDRDKPTGVIIFCNIFKILEPVCKNRRKFKFWCTFWFSRFNKVVVSVDTFFTPNFEFSEYIP